jgi:hypothetical protein
MWNDEQQYQPLAPSVISMTNMTMNLNVKKVLVVSNNTPAAMGMNDALAFIEPKSPLQMSTSIRHTRTTSTWGEEGSKDEAALDLSRGSLINLWRTCMTQPLHFNSKC